MDYGARYYSPGLGRFVSPDSIIPNPINPQDFNRYSYSRSNPLRYVDPTGHWPDWVDFIAGAAYQFSNDMTVGIPNAAFGTDWLTEQSSAFQAGQQVGRGFSKAAGWALTADGAGKIAAGISLMPPTAGVGAACTAATEGACSIPTVAGLAIETTVVGAGVAEAAYGNAVFLMAAKNPVSGGSADEEETGRWGIGASETKTIKGYKSPSVKRKFVFRTHQISVHYQNHYKRMNG